MRKGSRESAKNNENCSNKNHLAAMLLASNPIEVAELSIKFIVCFHQYTTLENYEIENVRIVMACKQLPE